MTVITALLNLRAKNVNEKVFLDFFTTLATVLSGLNLSSKPMLIYNMDKTGHCQFIVIAMPFFSGHDTK